MVEKDKGPTGRGEAKKSKTQSHFKVTTSRINEEPRSEGEIPFGFTTGRVRH